MSQLRLPQQIPSLTTASISMTGTPWYGFSALEARRPRRTVPASRRSSSSPPPLMTGTTSSCARARATCCLLVCMPPVSWRSTRRPSGRWGREASRTAQGTRSMGSRQQRRLTLGSSSTSISTGATGLPSVFGLSVPDVTRSRRRRCRMGLAQQRQGGGGRAP